MQRYFGLGLLLILPLTANAQSISLRQCFDLAKQNNQQIKQSEQSIQTRRYQYQAAKLNMLPKLDLLGGYTYLSDPIRINLQSVREGIVNGTSQQNVDAANRVYRDITGNSLSSSTKEAIRKGSQDIINEVYPNYNPELSERSYFTAGLSLRLPLYMGGKIRTGRQVAKNRYKTGQLNKEMTEDAVKLAVTGAYLKVLYLNSLIQKQEQLLALYQKTEQKAASLVKNEIIPPYQQHWAHVALLQAETGLQKVKMGKRNALLTLQNLLGIDSAIRLTDTLQAVAFSPSLVKEQFWSDNTGYQWLQGKTEVAKSAVKASRSLSLPNIYGVANYQFLRKNLPIMTPPWEVGVVFQWNLFSSFQNLKHIQATKSMLQESQLLAEQKKTDLQWKVKVAKNKLLTFQNQMNTLKKAKREAGRTTKMVRRRMKNQLSSIKDVNEALKIQLEAEKAYYTSVFAYNTAVATYLNIIGRADDMMQYIN